MTIYELAVGTKGQKELGVKLSAVSVSLLDQYESYLGAHFSNFWAFRAADFLDPRISR